MKKIMLLCFVIGAFNFSNAQIDFGVKAGINYNSNSINEVQADVLQGGNAKTGFHGGVWLRAKVSVLNLFIRPEFLYTQLKNGVTFGNFKGNYTIQKLDIPVLVGKKFLNVLSAYAGPSFQYILNGKLDVENIKSVDVDGFTVGVVLGLGVDISNFGLYVNWERGFTDKESKFISNNSNQPFKFDTRVNQINVGVSYKF